MAAAAAATIVTVAGSGSGRWTLCSRLSERADERVNPIKLAETAIRALRTSTFGWVQGARSVQVGGG